MKTSIEREAVTQPVRIQRRNSPGWRAPADAVYVGPGTRWANPFQLHDPMTGLVRQRPGDPSTMDFEHRISSAGARHDWWDASGRLVEYEVRWATPAELVWLHRRTLLDPMPGMRAAKLNGRFAPVTENEVKDELAGRDLVCWCPLGVACHADALLEIANSPLLQCGRWNTETGEPDFYYTNWQCGHPVGHSGRCTLYSAETQRRREALTVGA
jgi:hypothetical protein